MIGKMKLTLAAAAAAAVMAFGSGDASANTVTCNFVQGNPNQTTTYEMVVTNSVACGVAGNDSAAAIGNIPGLTSPPAWTLAWKSDGPDGDKAITGSGFVNGQKSGVWSISSFPELTQVVIALKAGNNFAAFLLEPFISSGEWELDRGLSHASIYYRSCEEGDAGCGISTTPIPLPAAGFLLIGALGGLAVLRRRKKAA